MKAVISFTHEELCNLVRAHLSEKHNISSRGRYNKEKHGYDSIPVMFSVLLDDDEYRDVTISAQVTTA